MFEREMSEHTLRAKQYFILFSDYRLTMSR
jgi:hypothetical protein